MAKRTWRLLDGIKRLFIRSLVGEDFADKPIIDKTIRQIAEARIGTTYRMLVGAVYTNNKDAALSAGIKLVEAVENANEFVLEWRRRNQAKQDSDGNARTKRATGRH